MSSELLCREAFEQWVGANRKIDLPTGCSVDEAMSFAKELLARVDSGAQVSAVEWRLEIPDTLHAVCEILRLGPRESTYSGAIAIKIYGVVEGICWPADGFEEREQILASLAFEAWTECRRAGRFDLMPEFETRCERHSLRQGVLREFLAQPLVGWPDQLRSRFLSEPATLLTSVMKLGLARNLDPESVSRDAPLLRAWLLAGAGGNLRRDEWVWLASQVAIVQSGVLRLLGELNEAKRWLNVAEQDFTPDVSFDLLKVQAELTMLAIRYDGGALEQILAGIPSLVGAAADGGMEAELLKARFLEACVLKDLGSPLAMERFRDLVQPFRARGDSLFLGLCFVKMADLLNAGVGDVATAMQHLKEAGPLLERAGSAWGLADLHGTIGEVLRDQGHLNEAIEAYRRSLRLFLDGELSCRSTYLRIVLAETLILAGRDEEAATELVAALPLIERESLARQGVVAIALLREALKNRKMDPAALRILRDQMDFARKGGEL